jgi:eukaryotic-like serine/threonine-protein kinase
MESPQKPSLQIPGVKVLDEIGRGAMSVVYRAERDGRELALKLMQDQSRDRAIELGVQFRREAAALCRLNNPGLVKFFDIGEYQQRPYLLMELAKGQTLDKVMAGGRLSKDATLALAKILAGALTEVHRHGFVHRDVKPANVVMLEGGGAKLIDFGLVNEMAEQRLSEGTVGTLLYAAPEQTGVLKRPVDGRSDLYALGAMLFECVTGGPPFTADSASELIREHMQAPIPDPTAVNPEIGPALGRIIRKLLAKDPDERYQTTHGLITDLDGLPAIEAALRAGGEVKLGAQDELFRAVNEVPLIGRDAEAKKLNAALQDAFAGRGRHCLVEGEGGLGKTRLCREVTRAARTAGAPVLTSKCNKAEQVPYGVFRDAVDQHLARLLRLEPAARPGRGRWSGCARPQGTWPRWSRSSRRASRASSKSKGSSRRRSWTPTSSSPRSRASSRTSRSRKGGWSFSSTTSSGSTRAAWRCSAGCRRAPRSYRC